MSKYRSAWMTGRSLSKNSRPQNILYAGLLAALVAYQAGASLFVSIACYILIMMLYALVTSLNNIADVSTDRLNHRHDNPLTGSELKTRTVRIFVWVCLGVILLAQPFFQQPSTLLIVIAYLGLGVAYSQPRLRVMSRGFWAPLVLAICYGGLPFLLGVAQGSGINPYLALLQVGLIVPLVLAKDYKDLYGDKRTGKKTPLVLYGHAVVARVAVLVAMFGVIAFVYLAISQAVNGALIFLLSTLYLTSIVWLHVRRGNIPRFIRLGIAVVMLVMTWCVAMA